MKLIGIIILSALLCVIGLQSYRLFMQSKDLQKDADKLSEQAETLRRDNNQLQADLQYLSQPENVEKELRAQGNYRRPDESLIIVVPPKSQ